MAAATGLLFVLTALQRPSFAGTCSHAVGVAVGAILLGPRVMTALGLVVSLSCRTPNAHVLEEGQDLFFAQNDRELLGNLHASELRFGPGHVQGHGIEELDRGEETVDGIWR